MSYDELPPLLRSLAAAIKAEKNRSVRTGTDPSHLVDIFRHGKRILRVAVPEPEDCLRVLYNAPGAMSADYVAVGADSWTATGPTNPITGRPWEIGDMDRMVAEDLGLHRGLVTEQIMISGFARNGESPMAVIPYEHDREGATIRWLPPMVSESSDGGRFPSAAADGFARPDIVAELIEVLGEPPEGCDLEPLRRKAAVTWVHGFPEHYRVMQGPKGPPLSGRIAAGYG